MFASKLFRGFAKYQTQFKTWKIVKGDQVYVNTGKDKGKIGQVVKVYRKTNQCVVDGINVRLREIKNNPSEMEKGGVIPINKPIHMSNLNLIDPETGRGTKVRIGYLSDGSKVRISKKSKQIIPKPNMEPFSYAARHRGREDGPNDTPAKLVMMTTYKGEDFGSIRDEFESYIQEKERLESLLVFDK
jgi:large subunit ribosomal protein L24